MMGPNASEAIRVAKLESLAVFASLVDDTDRVRDGLDQVGLMAYRPFFEFFWSFCPLESIADERRLHREVLREVLGSEYFTTERGRVQIGYISPDLSRARAEIGDDELGSDDLLRSISLRERAHLAARVADPDGLRVARAAANARAQQCKLGEIYALRDRLYLTRMESLLSWAHEAINRYFGPMGFVKARSPVERGLIAAKAISSTVSVSLVLKEPYLLEQDSYFGNFGLDLAISIDTADGRVYTKKPAFDLVDGFRSYSICRDEAEVALAWYAHATVLGVIDDRLSRLRVS
ncbi:MAG TPA: hypothetical protein VFL86_09275 [Burkholderiaceae bacterium]|nr:hypothetical protein [Burkholderiaceae bacterium]